ncbi:MAG: sensor histidine kinase, partial [Alphaproteobacteria bacterium]
HARRMWTILAGAFLFGLLLSVYVAQRPPAARMPVMAAFVLALIAALLVPLYDGKILGVLLIFFMTAFALSLRQWLKGHEDAAFLTGGTGLFLAAMILNVDAFLDRSVYIAFGLLLTALMFVEVRAHRRALRRRHEAELAAARLEGELTKRQLQPHFLMNTLTSLMEWVEQKPEAASRMIEALSGEYRLLRKMQPRTLVPVAEELELCRAHLDVMRYRTDRTFRLETAGVDLSAAIPPGLFHTLIENAFSHGGWRNGKLFTLEERKLEGGGRLYRFTAPGPPAEPNPSASNGREGIGLSYIRARLGESFGGAWRLTSRPCAAGWETLIEVPENEYSHRRG